MSWIVFLIAVVPAIGIVVIAEKTRSKGAVLAAAIVAAGLGLLTGNPAYIGIDLLFVGIATYISLNITKKPIYRTPEEIAAAQEKSRLARIAEQEAKARQKKSIAEFFQGALMLGAVVFVLFGKFWQPSAPNENIPHVAMQPQLPPVATQPNRATVKPEKPQKVNSAQSSPVTQQSAKKTPLEKKNSVEKCLKIPDEQAMVRCLERAQ